MFSFVQKALVLINQIQFLIQMSGKLLKQIKQRIKEEGPIEEIVELSLEELNIPTISNDIKKLLEKAKNLEILILADNSLENVDNLPKLGLTVLDLSSNKINDAALKKIAQFQDLGQLILIGNQIKTFEALKPLFKLKKLVDLDLSENPVAQLAGYRELLFKEIPSLQILDRADKDGKEISEEDEQSGSDEQQFEDDQQNQEEEEGSQSENNAGKSNKK